MTVPKCIIRPQYISLVKRYEKEKDTATKIQMKHKFVEWITLNCSNLTDAELEFLQTSICPVPEIYY